MEISLFIARVLGIFYLVAAAGMILNRQFYQKFMEDYCKNSALVFFSGMFALVIGVVIILTHNLWVANWTVIITIIGWAHQRYLDNRFSEYGSKIYAGLPEK